MGMDMHTKADHRRQRRRGTKENDADNSATDGLSNELAQAQEEGCCTWREFRLTTWVPRWYVASESIRGNALHVGW